VELHLRFTNYEAQTMAFLKDIFLLLTLHERSFFDAQLTGFQQVRPQKIFALR